MAMRVIKADERLAEKRGIKLLMLGKPGIGKTWQVRTLPAEISLVFEFEGGELPLIGWNGDLIRTRRWGEFCDALVLLTGPNPALPTNARFSTAHYEHVKAQYPEAAEFERYQIVVIDSMTALSRICFADCKLQPAAQSERSGRTDLRAAYGLLSQEMLAAIQQLQHARHLHVVMTAIVDEKLDDFNRKFFVAQMEGSKTALELPGIVDEVVTLTEIKDDEGRSRRVFVCQTLNPWQLPAKDRSGRLDTVEEPHLGKLIQKCLGGKA
ncbi:MAG: ATP-binding protein [Pseudomonadota bacterium]|jgi:hypothetical protein